MLVGFYLLPHLTWVTTFFVLSKFKIKEADREGQRKSYDGGDLVVDNVDLTSELSIMKAAFETLVL